MRSATILADAFPDAGLGHLARTSAIATALAVRGVEVRCLAVGPGGPIPDPVLHWERCPSEQDIERTEADLLVLDSYRLEPVRVRERLPARLIAVLHDEGPVPDADLVISTDPAAAGPAVCSGPQLACLGTAYWGLPEPGPVPPRLGRVLVTMGGGDPGGHAASVAGALHAALPGVVVELVRGPQAEFVPPHGVHVLERPPRMLEPLMGADLAVTAAGSSLLEALAVGTPTVGLIVAENQRAKAENLARAGATELVDAANPGAVAETVVRLGRAPGERAELVRRGRGQVDGLGALRVAFLLERLLSERR